MPGRSRAPAAAPDLLQSLDFFLDDAKAIVIVTAGDREDALPFLQVLGATFLPNHVVTVVQQGAQLEEHAEWVPIVEAKRATAKAKGSMGIHRNTLRRRLERDAERGE